MTNPQAGWHPDPAGRHEYRYWDGSTWTDQVSDSGVTTTDALAATGAAGPEATAATASAPTQVAPTPAGPPGAFPGAAEDEAKKGPNKGLLIGGAVAVVALIVGAVVLLTGGDDDNESERASTVAEDTDDTGSAFEDSDPDDLFGDTDGDLGDLDDLFAELDDAFGDLEDLDGLGGMGDLGDLDDLFGDMGNLPGADDDPVPFIADMYQQMFGLTEPQATCLAESIMDLAEDAEALEDPDAMMGDMFGAVFGAFDRCGISMNDLMAGGFAPPGG